MAGTRKSSKKKCCVCGFRFDSELIVTYDKKNYCENCGPKEIKRIEKEKKDNKALNDYIYQLCGEDSALMPLMGKQIKNMKEEYEFKSSGILATLRYMYEILDPPIEFIPEYGLANVPYFYYQARKFHEQYFNVKKQAENEIEVPPPRIITLKRSDIIQEEEEFWRIKKQKEMGSDIDLNALVMDINLEE